MAAVGCHTPGPRPGGKLRLGGAQIAVELVQSWLREADTHAFLTEQVAPIYLSQHGFEQLARGECDLACTDRPITPRELPQFGSQPPQGRRVAFYGYALYVHPDNPLDSIYAGHVELVFQGRVTDWSQLAGRAVEGLSGPIHLYGPPKGTRAGQTLAPLARIWFAQATWQELDSDAAIVAAVRDDPLGLGFASIGYDQGARYLGLRMERQGKPALPSLEEIERETYGLAKVIYVYYTPPATSAVQHALDYLYSDAAREVIMETDLLPIDRARATVSDKP